MRLFLFVSTICLFLFSCGSETAPKKEPFAQKHAHNHDHEHEHAKEKKGHHEHTAPNGGSLIVIGEEFAHIEMLPQVEKGQIVCYIYDADLKFGEKAEQGVIECAMTYTEMQEPLSLEFLSSVDELASNTKDNSSEFVAKVDLNGKTNIKLQLKSVKLKGKTFHDIVIGLK